MLQWVTITALNLIENAGYAGIAVISFLENIFTPIPSEAVIPFAGVLVQQGKFSLFVVILATTLGSVVGALFFYYLGFFLGAIGVRSWVVKWGRYLWVSEQDLNRAEEWFKKYDRWAVLLCRIIPLVRSFISIPAGYVKMPLLEFLILTGIGTTIWSSFLVGLGFVFGEAYTILVPYFRYLDILAAVLAIILIIYYTLRKKGM